MMIKRQAKNILLNMIRLLIVQFNKEGLVEFKRLFTLVIIFYFAIIKLNCSKDNFGKQKTAQLTFLSHCRRELTSLRLADGLNICLTIASPGQG